MQSKISTDPNNFNDVLDLYSEDRRQILLNYMDYLLFSNRYINLVSRRMTRKQLFQLVGESMMVCRLVKGAGIIDAGSGNGLLGVPMAIAEPERPVVLVETKVKKVAFLNRVKNKTSLSNVHVYLGTVEEYLRNAKSEKYSLVARGFPKIESLVRQLRNGLVGEILIVTTRKKMIKIKKGMERIRQNLYNIPFRDDIVIFKMENVSRET